MVDSLKNLAASIYARRPPRNGFAGSLPFAGKEVRYFSYGRHALHEAFVLARVAQGDTVLLPEYICRDTLAAANVLGARIAYYPVDETLRLAVPSESLPPARAIVAVNYFGFPQDLAPFEAYCRRTQAILIEDNAHGFLSRDLDGAYLGTRGDLGIFSFRKSLPLVNGSGLMLNHPEKFASPAPQLPYVAYPRSRMFRIKACLGRLPQWHLTALLYALVRLDRVIRRLRTGKDYVASDVDAERVLPGQPEPDVSLPDALGSLDAAPEIARRRSLYLAVEELVTRHGGQPVFPALSENVAPYGYPFRAPATKIDGIKRALNRRYLDCYLWPELPAEMAVQAPERYISVWLVNFIW